MSALKLPKQWVELPRPAFLDPDAHGRYRIPLRVDEPSGLPRHSHPVTSGVPIPEGALKDASAARVNDEAVKELPLQTQALARWPDVEGATLYFLSYVHHDNVTLDDFRISSVARTEKEIQASFAKGSLESDKFTLLIDKFEEVVEAKETRPQVMAAQVDGARKGTILANYAIWSEGKTGKSLRINEAK